MNFTTSKGRGTYGNVVETTDPGVVMKIYDNEDKDAHKREIAILQQLTGSQKNVVRSFGHGLLGDRPFVLLESLPFTLSDASPEIQDMSMEDQIVWARYLLVGVSRGLHFLKERGVVHADIKGDNIMIRQNNDPVLIDFSNSGILGKDGYIVDTPSLVGGAFCYASPEMILLMFRYYCRLNQAYDTNNIIPLNLKVGPQTDIYSLAGVVYRLMTQKYLNNYVYAQSHVLPDCYTEVTRRKNWKRRKAFLNLPASLRDVLSLMLKTNPQHRPTSESLLEHSFFHEDTEETVRSTSP